MVQQVYNILMNVIQEGHYYRHGIFWGVQIFKVIKIYSKDSVCVKWEDGHRGGLPLSELSPCEEIPKLVGLLKVGE